MPLTSSLLMATARVLARPGATTWAQDWSFLRSTGAPVEVVTASIGLGGHHMPPEASVAPTLASSTMLTRFTPRVNDAEFSALTLSATLRSGFSSVGADFGVANERMPSFTAMSTVGVTPTLVMRPTKPVLGDWARASVIE